MPYHFNNLQENLEQMFIYVLYDFTVRKNPKKCSWEKASKVKINVFLNFTHSVLMSHVSLHSALVRQWSAILLPLSHLSSNSLYIALIIFPFLAQLWDFHDGKDQNFSFSSRNIIYLELHFFVVPMLLFDEKNSTKMSERK